MNDGKNFQSAPPASDAFTFIYKDFLVILILLSDLKIGEGNLRVIYKINIFTIVIKM
jgi:hypothetical protein